MTKKQREKEEAKEYLSKLLKPGDEIVCILRHVSRSGMARDISLYFIKDGSMIGISYQVSRLLDMPLKEQQGSNCVRVGGCGMDMGFHTVYNIGRVLFPQGFGLKGTKRDNRKARKDVTVRPSSKEEVAQMVKKGVQFFGRNGDTSGWDNDGGYALICRWL